MCDKQIYDLTSGDIEACGVWYFPMDESVMDELTVRPVKSRKEIDGGFQVIVRTFFYGKSGERHIGYIYWGEDLSLRYIQPVIFVNGLGCINFWTGIVEPAWDDYSPELQSFRSEFPVSFLSDELFGLESLSGCVDGLCGYKDGRIVVVS